MPYKSTNELPNGVKNALPPDGQKIFLRAYNGAEKSANTPSTEESKNKVAWAAVKNAGYTKQGNKWVKKGARDTFTVVTKISDVEEEKRRIFGWGYVSVNKQAAEVVDHSEESASIEEVEEAFYGFNKLSERPAGEMHLMEGGSMIECMVFTKEKWEALGVDPAGMPQGAWVGFEFEEGSPIWKGIKDGTYRMLSIEGSAIREMLEVA